MAIDPGRDFDKIVVVQLSLAGQGYGVLQQAFGFGNGGLHGPRMVAFGVDFGQFHSLFDKGELVVGVIDGIVALQAHALAVAAQHSGAKGVESAGENRRRGPFADQPLNAFPHFPGRLVGKGNSGDGVGADPINPRQIGDAVGDDPGFAAARPGYQQQRPLGMQHRIGLRRIQPGQQFPFVSIHRGIIA